MFVFLIGIVVGTALTLLAVIVIAPSRRVRAEPPLELETQLRLLLGMDPEDTSTPLDVSALPPDWTFNTSQIQVLRDLDHHPDDPGDPGDPDGEAPSAPQGS